MEEGAKGPKDDEDSKGLDIEAAKGLSGIFKKGADSGLFSKYFKDEAGVDKSYFLKLKESILGRKPF
jgi:hypothetical protein